MWKNIFHPYHLGDLPPTLRFFIVMDIIDLPLNITPSVLTRLSYYDDPNNDPISDVYVLEEHGIPVGHVVLNIGRRQIKLITVEGQWYVQFYSIPREDLFHWHYPACSALSQDTVFLQEEGDELLGLMMGLGISHLRVGHYRLVYLDSKPLIKRLQDASPWGYYLQHCA